MAGEPPNEGILMSYRTITITHPSGLIEQEYTNRVLTLDQAVAVGELAVRNYTANPDRYIHLLFTVKDEEGVVEHISPTYTQVMHECGSQQFIVVDALHTCTWCDEALVKPALV